jgi:F-type H+-transporting ATPase subunit delta
VKNLAIARRYAKALLLIGKEDGKAETYREELDGFASMLEENPALEQALSNPLYESGQRRKILVTLLEKLSPSRVFQSFIMLLFDKRRIGFVSDISGFYGRLADELKGVARASLVSATELPDETVEKIRAALSKRTGKDIILETEQDPNLIGGIVTRIGDLVLDGSIKTQLLNMSESLKRGESV